MDEKICPIFKSATFIAGTNRNNDSGYANYCLKERCALWVKGCDVEGFKSEGHCGLINGVK